jgi:hypothetical protein
MGIDDISRRSITRRNVLKGGAVLGGVVWTAPIVETLIATPASAQSEQHFCCFCFSIPAGPTPSNNCGTIAATNDGGLFGHVEADGSPTSANQCACDCKGFGYTNFQWSGPSPTAFIPIPSSPPPPGFCGCFLNGDLSSPQHTTSGLTASATCV